MVASQAQMLSDSGGWKYVVLGQHLIGRFAEIGVKGVAPCSFQLVPYTWMRSAKAGDVHKEECHRMV